MNTAAPQQGQRRARDSNRARHVIVDAAEVVFAEHGFHGARIEAIAKASGYNVSLLFQYFGDKVGLYTAVLGRANDETTQFQAQLLGRGLTDETIGSDAQQFRAFLESLVHSTFDYLAEHPRLLRILTWEMANGWQTYARIAAQFEPDEGAQQMEVLFKSARRAGWLRSEFPAMLQLTLIFQVCQSYFAFLPFYQAIPTGDQVASAPALSARDYLAQFIAAGMMFDSLPGNEKRRRRAHS
jgi:TetR/AcrR family transcriptional regulator